MRAGGFPRAIRIPGRGTGKTLVWSAVEVAQHLAQRVAERDLVPKNAEGAPTRERPDDSISPFAAGRNEDETRCQYTTTKD
jgi:hypothetical protein